MILAGRPHRVVWHMPRGAYALERAGDIVAIGWLRISDIDRRFRDGDIVLVSPATLADLQAADLARAA